jgi:hypothetical protein
MHGPEYASLWEYLTFISKVKWHLLRLRSDRKLWSSTAPGPRKIRIQLNGECEYFTGTEINTTSMPLHKDLLWYPTLYPSHVLSTVGYYDDLLGYFWA